MPFFVCIYLPFLNEVSNVYLNPYTHFFKRQQMLQLSLFITEFLVSVPDDTLFLFYPMSILWMLRFLAKLVRIAILQGLESSLEVFRG